ncbi:hypothetical protein AYO40_05735 [Planctomycetaceae bacterium SCGC AG-212-D15]|nr:hypothetical protein AYO40_05735 [Planctomycetaceae bacterium SCGC AG-212-D15]
MIDRLVKFSVVATLGLVALITILELDSRVLRPTSTMPIKVILPTGYTGNFFIVRDRVLGQDLVQRDGFWVFEVPDSGILRIKDDDPFYQWHGEVVVDRGGHPVIVRDLGTSPGTSEGSTDGTTHGWEAIAPSAQR